MSLTVKARVSVVAVSLVLGACTETIIREMPAAAADPQTPATAVVPPSVESGVNMIPVNPTVNGGTNTVTATEVAVTTPAVGGGATMVPAVTETGTNTVVEPATQPPAIVSPVPQSPAIADPVSQSPEPSTPVTQPATTLTPATQAPVVATPATQTPDIVVPVTQNPPTTTADTALPIVANSAGELPTLADPATELPASALPSTEVAIPDSQSVLTPVVINPGAIPTSETQLLEPDAEMTVGSPGVSVDCQQTLPCRWVSDDLQFSLTVTNADNIASQSHLSINYSIETVHDTQVFVSRADDALDADGVRFKAANQILGGGNGGTPQGVIAGTPVEGTLNFDAGTTADSISNWSIAILDGGMLRNAMFTGIPVGTVTTAQADCQNIVPCVWTTPSSDVVITLQSVGGISIGSRLTANFSVETTSNLSVAVDAGSVAYGSEGTVIQARTHTFVSDTNYLKVSAPAIAGVQLFGSVNFYRTESVPTSLQLLSLVIYPDQPVPRWNPQFINVPVQ